MWRVLLVIVVLADPDLISSVGSTRGLSLGNTASNSNNYCFGCCGLHACLVVGCGGCGMWIEIPAMSPQTRNSMGIDIRTDRNDVVPFPQFRYGFGINT